MDRQDALNAMTAAINQLPTTMESSRAALEFIYRIRANGRQLDDEVLKLLGLLTTCLLQIDSRLEQLEGRPAVPIEQMNTLLGEFGST